MTSRSRLAATLLPVLLASACGDDTGAAATDYTALLDHLTLNVAMPALQAAATSADSLATAVHAVATDANAQTLTTAQTAWRDARAKWRRLDAFHFGPVADDGISDRIDVAPAAPADIDAVIAGTQAIDVAYVGTLGGKSKGFLGLEYLLFAKGGSAAALTALQGDGAAARRRALAAAVADEIAASAHALYDAWDPQKGGYATQVRTAGKTSTRYPRQRGAVDDYVGGVSYAVEWVVGFRLAWPLGRKSTGMPDPAQDFTAASDSAVADMKASLVTPSASYLGAGYGQLVKSFSQTLDQRAQMQMTDCANAIAAIPAPFGTSVVSNTPVVQAAYDTCKAWKLTWNTDVTSALGATLRVHDSDGD